MGRPLYSRTLSSTPAVREPEPPTCERWSYLNAFDPDSDEFFDNENAVYEDFLSPVTPVNPEEDEDEEDEEERDMLVVRMGNASPISSESSLSDDESPLAFDEEDPAHLVVDAFHGIRHMDEEESEPAVRVRLATRPMSAEARWGSQTTEVGRPGSQRRLQLTSRGAYRSISYRQRHESLPIPAPSAPIPVPAVSRRTAAFDEPFSSPSTPPRQTPMAHFSMSPPPTSTPRLYTWRTSSHSTSPTSGSPFTNPHARTSYTHLSPALIRIRDVII